MKSVNQRLALSAKSRSGGRRILVAKLIDSMMHLFIIEIPL